MVLQKLNPIQELKLLDALSGFFCEQKETSFKNTMFLALFSNIPDKGRSDILAKLISMAVGIENKALLESTALWMQVSVSYSLHTCIHE